MSVPQSQPLSPEQGIIKQLMEEAGGNPELQQLVVSWALEAAGISAGTEMTTLGGNELTQAEQPAAESPLLQARRRMIGHVVVTEDEYAALKDQEPYGPYKGGQR